MMQKSLENVFGDYSSDEENIPKLNHFGGAMMISGV